MGLGVCGSGATGVLQLVLVGSATTALPHFKTAPTPATRPHPHQQAHLRSSSVLMGSTGSLQKMDSWKSCSRRWRKTDTGACWPPPCTGDAVQPHWCSTGGRTCRTKQVGRQGRGWVSRSARLGVGRGGAAGGEGLPASPPACLHTRCTTAPSHPLCCVHSPGRRCRAEAGDPGWPPWLGRWRCWKRAGQPKSQTSLHPLSYPPPALPLCHCRCCLPALTRPPLRLPGAQR